MCSSVKNSNDSSDEKIKILLDENKKLKEKIIELEEKIKYLYWKNKLIY